MLVIATLLLASQVLVPAPAKAPDNIDYSAAYGECQSAVGKGSEVLAKCERLALDGIPGAQFGLGAFLINRPTPAEIAQGIEWLEKAAATGHPGAAYYLAGALATKKDDVSRTRSRALFRSAICAGYPAALEALAQQGVARNAVECVPEPELDFSGEWSLRLKWNKGVPATAAVESYRLVIRDGAPRVYYKNGKGDWIEAKAGKFTFTQLERSATVAVTDSGWDLDGKWIESWTIQLMRTGTDEATVAYLRTVNNEHLLAHLTWRTFATFAEGTASRVKR
jgi:hypothetical protein